MPDTSRASRQPGTGQPCLAVLAAMAATKELAFALAVQPNSCVISTHL